METVISFLFVTGALFVLVAAVGVLRLPDVFSRMHAASKASSLGLGLMLTGAALRFGSVEVVLKCLSTAFFLFLTAPLAAHILSRAAYLNGARPWERSKTDELGPFYRSEGK